MLDLTSQFVWDQSSSHEPLGKFRYGETEYGIGIVPLGGYVKMLGQDDDPRKQEEEAKRIQVENEGEEPEGTSSSQTRPPKLPCQACLATHDHHQRRRGHECDHWSSICCDSRMAMESRTALPLWAALSRAARRGRQESNLAAKSFRLAPGVIRRCISAK